MQAIALGIVSAIGAWIAARQMIIAHDRLLMDNFHRLYSKRIVVFEETRKILAKAYDDVTEDDVRAYGLFALDAQFLFDDEMYKYLREIRQRVDSVRFASDRIRESATPEKEDYARIKAAHFDWLRQQGDEVSGFAMKFRPFLVLEFPKRNWLLRWPT